MDTTQVGLLERIRAKSEPVILPEQVGAGQLMTWLKRPGEWVERYEPLATILVDEMDVELTATVSGSLRVMIVREGSQVEPGATLCYIEPDTSHQNLPQAARCVRKGQVDSQQGKQQQAVPRLSERPTGDSASSLPSNDEVKQTNGRRSTMGARSMPPVEELTLEEPSPEQTVERKELDSSSRPKKTVHKTYHLEEGQVKRIKQLALRLQLNERTPDCNESELVRAAVEMLLDLPEPALLAIIQENRRREAAGGYGSGWRHPSKG